ncbi:uncharacterized protein GLRG_06226 [Colletotrichum graminicola M1.001]|uniref:BZIP domain-containing protein n=1 Tax=Colletotrichum graminicola (strain M1.001 / M2 / FGSC 10212) TaxID=645133 RepID=E3QJP4_COLGM|nr:uncharacterized protein GLRG_06226 [Colletotrichum graminicola M1.001]EFQ31082.1 hypothetical protein GLRG_06226 [Colletotrichum graminicola M1.001]
MDNTQKTKEKRKFQNRIAQRRFRNRKKGIDELFSHPTRDFQTVDNTIQESSNLAWDQQDTPPLPLQSDPQNIFKDTEVANTLGIVVEDPLLSDLGISILDQWLQDPSLLSPLSGADSSTNSTESSHYLNQHQTDSVMLYAGNLALVSNNNSDSSGGGSSYGNITLEIDYAKRSTLPDNNLPTNRSHGTAGHTSTVEGGHTAMQDILNRARIMGYYL